MRITEKEHKKIKKKLAETSTKTPTTKKLKQTSDIPAWFDKEKETVEPTETDREAFDELDKILQELV